MTKHKLSEPTKYEMPMIDEKPWKQLIKHVERLDDTVTRLTLEMKAMKELMITPDDFDYLGCLKSTYEKHVTNQENEDE